MLIGLKIWQLSLNWLVVGIGWILWKWFIIQNRISGKHIIKKNMLKVNFRSWLKSIGKMLRKDVSLKKLKRKNNNFRRNFTTLFLKNNNHKIDSAWMICKIYHPTILLNYAANSKKWACITKNKCLLNDFKNLRRTKTIVPSNIKGILI